MNRILWAVVLLLALAAPAAEGPAISYFTNVREIAISQPAAQNYFVVDEEIWSHARPDLADLRILQGETQVQYALHDQRGRISSQEAEAKILNLGKVRGHTEFDLDMGPISQYDRVRLSLDAKDFVLTASVAGTTALDAKSATELPPSTLYDFSQQQLGANSVLKLPPSSFRYLHVKLGAGISPPQVRGATVYNLQETRANWTRVGACGAPRQVARTTVVACRAPEHVPVDRVRFQVDPQAVNFRRAVVVSDAEGHQYGNSGEITRVRLNRGPTTVVSEQMDVQVGGPFLGPLKITVDNGDNPPLTIEGVQLLSLERRIYFDPQGKSQLRLYYGDLKLDAPVYDYARFFKADPAAAKAELRPGAHNEAYRGRPDDRPWSERHSAVLWAAMLLAVVMLAALAIRGLTTDAKNLSP
jgi:hypothetical protein